MSSEIQIGTGALSVKQRRPWVVVALSVVTLGIYQLVWYYKINREMRDVGIACDDAELAGSSPVRSILAVTLGGLIVIPEVISLIGTVRRVQRVERLATGRARPAAIPTALFITAVVLRNASGFRGLELVGLVSAPAFLAAIALIQSRLNRACTVAGAAVIGSGCSAQPAPGHAARPHSVSASHVVAESTGQQAAPAGQRAGAR